MKILIVCLGNICRSPLAEGILKAKIEERNLEWLVDSAGTSNYHIGDLPDQRSINIARKHGLDITKQRARQFLAPDFENFDLIIAMDSSNYQNVRALARTEGDKKRVKLMMNFLHPGMNMKVPDPYYDNNFEGVYEMLDRATDAMIDQMLEKD